MPRRARWVQLLPGIAATLALVAAIFAVLVFARVGALHGDRMRIYAPTSQARGVIKGTEVWLAGQKIGLVNTVRFRPASVDTIARLVLVLDVLTTAATQIRRDSYAQIRTGGTLIGAPVVYVSAGSVDSPLLADGDTLATRPQNDVEGFTSQFAYAAKDLGPVVQDVRTIMSQLDSARGSAGAILGSFTDRSGDRALAVFQARAGRLTRSVTAGDGTIGLALRGGDLEARARHAVAQTDSIRALLSSGATSVGRFRRDSTLLRSLADVRNEVSITRSLVTTSRGTAGRALNDSALVNQLAQVEKELGALIRDVKQRPLRYVAF
jgi:phospholipid/cholesterol/gamma-HCH transport system substrate-binding protein